MKKIIVVTGGAGFVGSNLIELLVKKTKYNIISIDDYSSGIKKNHIVNKKVKYFNCPTKNIEKILNKHKQSHVPLLNKSGQIIKILDNIKYNQHFFSINLIKIKDGY